MIELLTIASTPKAFGKETGCDSEGYFTNHFVKADQKMPIIMSSGLGPMVESASWGMRLPDVSKKLLLHVPLNGVLSKPKVKILFRKQRAIIPVNCFCVSKGDEVFLIRLLHNRLFGLGGICRERKVRGQTQYEFALMTTAAPDILQPYTNEVPVIAPLDKLDKWLGDRELHKVMHTADRTGNYWFDFFKVSPLVLDDDALDKELLKPLGMSFQQIKYRDERLRSLKIKHDRANRSGK